MKQTILITFLVCLIGAGLGSRTIAQVQHIGYVNSAKILLEFREAQEAQRKIDSLGRTWQGELDKLSKNLQLKYEEFQKKEAMLSEQAKRDQKEELVVLEQKGYQYRQQKFGAEGELASATESLLVPIKKKVMKVIESVSKEEKIQFMLDRNDQFLVLLYGDATYDYTYKVIDRLKRGKVSDK